jgi:rhodanese-related sulfurtransferase
LEIGPAEVRRMMNENQPLHLVDCREEAEHKLASIEGAELIPMNSVRQRLQYLEGVADEKLIVVHCHHGMRSLSVVNWLRGQGVENCVSMAGGIDLWSAQVDPHVPRY